MSLYVPEFFLDILAVARASVRTTFDRLCIFNMLEKQALMECLFLVTKGHVLAVSPLKSHSVGHAEMSRFPTAIGAVNHHDLVSLDCNFNPETRVVYIFTQCRGSPIYKILPILLLTCGFI